MFRIVVLHRKHFTVEEAHHVSTSLYEANESKELEILGNIKAIQRLHQAQSSWNNRLTLLSRMSGMPNWIHG